MSKVFRVFPNSPPAPIISKGDGVYLFTKDGRRLLDMTGGSTSYAILGWSHPEVISAMQKQLHRFGHVDYKVWSDENVELLADLLLSKAEHSLDRIYFSGIRW